MDGTAHLLEQLLLWVMLPLWMLAGLADWACHRVQGIEYSAGVKESWLHIAMVAELGVGTTASLAFEPTAMLLAILLTLCIAHEVTVWWDLVYATAHRVIPPCEQWVHGLQVAIPWACLAALMIAHRGQAAALVGLGTATAEWQLRWRDLPLPTWGWGAVISSAAVLVVLPVVQEHLRCRRAGRAR